MDYIANYHWIFYGLGFLFAPRLTIMIVLSVHFKGFIPSFLMFLGWFVAITDFISFKEGE